MRPNIHPVAVQCSGKSLHASRRLISSDASVSMTGAGDALYQQKYSRGESYGTQHVVPQFILGRHVAALVERQIHSTKLSPIIRYKREQLFY